MVSVVNSYHALTNKICYVVCRLAFFVEKFIVIKGGDERGNSYISNIW